MTSHTVVFSTFFTIVCIISSESKQPIWLSADISKVICNQQNEWSSTKSFPKPVQFKSAQELCGWFAKASCAKTRSTEVFTFKPCDDSDTSDEEPPYNGTGPKVRIVNGQKARPYKYPALVLLKYYGSHACAGSILNKNWVLSAAHCVLSSNPKDYSFVAGESSQKTNDKTEQYVKATQIIKHEEYNNKTQANDIALFQISPPFQFNDKVTPTNLPEPNHHVESGIGWVTGWGLTKENGLTSDILLEADVPIITHAKCKEYYKKFYIGPNMLCAGYEDGKKDACQGDSGGPFYIYEGVKQLQIGIVSWGRGCARKKSPGVYTEVSKYIGWIKQKVTDGW